MELYFAWLYAQIILLCICCSVALCLCVENKVQYEKKPEKICPLRCNHIHLQWLLTFKTVCKMDASKVDAFMMANSKYFPEERMMTVRDMLLKLDDDKISILATLQFKDPIVSLIISFFVGVWGIDRFFIGDMGMGVGKLLTCGGFGVWALIDLFLIMGATREKNLLKLQQYCY